MAAKSCKCLLLVLALSSWVHQSRAWNTAELWTHADKVAPKQAELTAANRVQLYTDAMQLRSQRGVAWRAQQRCLHGQLLPASGLRPSKTAPHPTTLPAYLIPDTQGATAKPVPGFPQLVLGETAHAGALRETALALMEGFGCDPHAQLALALLTLAADLGDPAAQGQMGVRYALGLHELSSWAPHGIVGFTKPDEDAAVLHYLYGAMGGDMLSRMALGVRHHLGLGVPKGCWTATSYYLPAAEEVADIAADRSGPGLPQVERIRLYVQHMTATRRGHERERYQAAQEFADKGNVDAQTAVGQVLNDGTHGVVRDHAAALTYLTRAAEAGDVQALAHLGHMHANGLGTPQDLEAAHDYFNKAQRQGSVSAQFGLGYMYLMGLGLAQDYEKAAMYLTQAAEHFHPDAQFYLGVMHLKGLGARAKSIMRAAPYFTLAAQQGHVPSMYQAAMLHLGGRGTKRNCAAAQALLKNAAERGPVAGQLQLGHKAYFRGSYQEALWHYLQAAEAGFELGAANAAWLLTHDYVQAEGDVEEVKYLLYQRSAAQGNVPSLVALGDAHFYGEGVTQDWARAAAIYYEAYQERSAEAMFNLGFMHEFGAGVLQDLQLARRFYDMAQHTNHDSALAVHCARAWLTLHQGWEAIKPRLPAPLAPLGERLWTLQPPYTSVLGSWTGLLAGLMPGKAVVQMELGAWSWLDALGLWKVLELIPDASESGETVLMALLLAALAYVMHLRRRRAAPGRGRADAGAQHAAQQQRQEREEQIAAQLLRAGLMAELLEQQRPTAEVAPVEQAAPQQVPAGNSAVAELSVDPGTNQDNAEQHVSSHSGQQHEHAAD